MGMKKIGTTGTDDTSQEVKGLKGYIQKKMSDLKTLVEKEVGELLGIEDGYDINGHNLDPATVLMNKLHQAVTDMLFTDYVTVNDNGNLDSSYPWVCRVFVPPSVKEIKESAVNIIVDRYRMDAATTDTQAETTKSVIITSGPSSKTTAKVRNWGPDAEMAHPVTAVQGIEDMLEMEPFMNTVYPGMFWTFTRQDGTIAQVVGRTPVGAVGYQETYAWIDMFKLQHDHNFDHYHAGQANITIPAHHHDNVPGIFVSTSAPSHVRLSVNGNDTGIDLSGDNQGASNLDITAMLVTGWNELTFSGANPSHVTVFGHVKVLEQYSV